VLPFLDDRLKSSALDLYGSLAVLALALAVGAAYSVRVALRGPSRSARAERDGKTGLVAREAIEVTLWSVAPVAAACVRTGVSANAVSWTALGAGVFAGIAVGAGHFGVAALLVLVCFLGDAIDGAVARMSGSASDAGALLDATLDRYVELAFLGGLALHFRASPAVFALVLGAVAGSFMVSYSSARSAALAVTLSRGAMRRAERAACLTVGVTLHPLLAALPLAERWADAPTIAALALVAIVGNVSAVRRLAAIARTIAARRRFSAHVRPQEGGFHHAAIALVGSDDDPQLPLARERAPRHGREEGSVRAAE
jgi:CDP-diacylglycerol---glycerol-3-phosphate 3-phosphatidyltransferase